MELGDKIDKFNIQSLSITIGKCASLSIVAKFDNKSDLQKFERFALGLLQQLRKLLRLKKVVSLELQSLTMKAKLL